MSYVDLRLGSRGTSASHSDRFARWRRLKPKLPSSKSPRPFDIESQVAELHNSHTTARAVFALLVGEDAAALREP